MILPEAKEFVTHFITGDYTPEEYATFLQWLKGATTDELNVIANEHEELHDRWPLPSSVPTPEWMAELEEKLDRMGEPIQAAPVKRIGTRRFTRKQIWLAAASLVILITAGTYYYKQEVGLKSDGLRHSAEYFSSILSTPRGGDQKQLVLPDGSKVWLNTASTLKFPSSFSGAERVVQLSGEAYFEVTRNSAMPFRVLVKDAVIEVLGTDFNIKAYEDEPFSRTTLVEGSVKIASGSQNALLKPGEQADAPYVSKGVAAPIRVIGGVDGDAVLAWRNGFLQFENDDLETVMREIGRCYNVDIQYEPNIPEKRISGSFSRKEGLSKILEQLSNLNIHFTNDGKTVKILH
jgi:ferric-dicitrate binding protein FerR (iron transport regulator)